MRLWHKKLIPVLPRQQLLGQWHECCAIARSIAEKGTPNHILVNKIMDYPLEQFEAYSLWVCWNMRMREYRCDHKCFTKWIHIHGEDDPVTIDLKNIFPDWHNNRYFLQCYYNLQEKYDCGGITQAEWDRINKTAVT